MGFWTFRISRPLDYPDVRYCQQGVYFQRIFNRGGAYLLTEDVLLCLKEAIVIVYFFHTISRSNPGLWKLACWPNLIERLEERLEDSSVPKDEQKLYGPDLILSSYSHTNLDQPFHSRLLDQEMQFH